MGKIADLVRDMIADGASPELIISAVELAEDAAGRRHRKKSEKDARATRLKRDWRPPLNDFRDATDWIGFDAAHRELERFRDYWVAQPGQKGVKLDWNATWRNWIRTAAERQQRSSRNGSGLVEGIGKVFGSAPRNGQPGLPSSLRDGGTGSAPNLLDYPVTS